MMLAALAHGYAVCGKGTEARKLLQAFRELSRQRYVPAYNLAEVHAGLGERDRAFEWLEKCTGYSLSAHTLPPQFPGWDCVRTGPQHSPTCFRFRLLTPAQTRF